MNIDPVRERIGNPRPVALISMEEYVIKGGEIKYRITVA